EGKILDGRNRYNACKLIFYQFTDDDFVEFDESWGIDPFDYVDSMNFHRRHLTTWQRAKWGLIHLAKEREKTKERQLSTLKQFQDDTVPSNSEGTEEQGEALDLAAKKVNVDRKTLWQVEKIVAVAETDPEIKDKVERLDKGKKNISITSIFNDIRQKERLEKIQEIATQPKKLRGKIIHGDFFQEIENIPNKSIDLLFVDPPYNAIIEDWDTFESRKAFREFNEQWLNLVIPKVKDTGRIYICSSQIHKYSFYSILQANLFFGFKFSQEIIWHYKNNIKPQNKKEYFFAYEPIFYLYGKNAKDLNFTHETFSDDIQHNVWFISTLQTNYSEGKLHPAQKPLELLRRIILTGSYEDDLILDPFAGSGTTGVVCEELNRNYILIEKNAEFIEIAQGRIKEGVK
ncbi:MAG TPA: site-specific DNA-methyltransferase, partial [Candidatus Paceibacterota bacterium]|nr:site-specific DNA-methyltransferase [Candidatus Paceibacterota bacterium]